ncbi:hypothetical protein SEENP078_15181 [Salmonella enterica subsp. enterica serovar Newport str. RI_10P078]|nr:hypothetical protein SEEN6417_00045 [Salmonella enterica subsp. enterica serovar Newport str. 637564_17]ESC43022.1 hypothetical protein SEENP078_15181 [Salmonella enterica subsp. enterica serovar Newport str. RI_10P078]
MTPNCGLSPLARGTQTLGARMAVLLRFIPAGAGNTGGVNFYVFHISVYPRWRGEHETFHTDNVVIFGLSPLARGTRCRGSI